MSLTVYYDDEQECDWFLGLDHRLAPATALPLSSAASDPSLAPVIQYDRPDILLVHEGIPVLVVERTVEVPSGHNVGQRFARLAAAAEHSVPVVYFGPFKARKHGGATAGPRFMNLRLFYALDMVEKLTTSAVTTIDWPVDADCELIRAAEKDDEVRSYVAELLDCVERGAATDLRTLAGEMRATDVYKKLHAQRRLFEATGVKRPEQYDEPPPSVRVLAGRTACREFDAPELAASAEVVVYTVGMKNVRSDPYTGMGMLYRYLYVLPYESRSLVLEFPEISLAKWSSVAGGSSKRKDVRLYRHVADGVRFRDGYRPRGAF